MKFRTIITTLAALAATFSLHGQDTGNWELTSTIDAGTLEITTADDIVTLGVQEITSSGVTETSNTVDISVEDLRGSNSPITISATLSPLKGTNTNPANKVRGTQISAGNFTGDTNGTLDSTNLAIAEDGSETTQANFVTATEMVNRFFGFTITVTADAMSRHTAVSGNYTGNILLQIN
jgi:hypothetical protein